MIKNCVRGLVVIGIIFIFNCSQNEEIGEFAPPDAYLEGAKHAYYGSENPWNRQRGKPVLLMRVDLRNFWDNRRGCNWSFSMAVPLSRRYSTGRVRLVPFFVLKRCQMDSTLEVESI